MRNNKKFMRLLKKAHLRYPDASLDDTIYDPDRLLDVNAVQALIHSDWIAAGRNLLITGKTGAGKSYYSKNDEQIQWVEDTIASMTIEEKIGQLFVNMVANAEERKPENIKKVLDTYHPGAIRYHNAPKEELWEMAKCLQDTTKVPLLIASNCEAGGNGGVNEGTPLANGAAMAAMDSEEAVYEMARISAEEGAAVGCNWNFAPIVDILYNWRNTIVQLRAFNNNPDDIIRYAKSFFKGMKTQNFATCMKHFPGDGTEENDQHLIMGSNDMSTEEWDKTFGKVYKELIDEGCMTIMVMIKVLFPNFVVYTHKQLQIVEISE